MLQQNGISERDGCTLIDFTLCLLQGVVIYPTHCSGTTHHILQNVRRARFAFQVNGSCVLVHFECHRDKLEDMALEGRLVGYGPNNNAYRVYNDHNRHVVESGSVTSKRWMSGAAGGFRPYRARNYVEHCLTRGNAR